MAGGPGKREAEATQDPNWAAILGPTMLASLFRGQRVKKDREGVVAGDDVGLQMTLTTYSWKELMAEESPSTRTVNILYWLYRRGVAQQSEGCGGREGWVTFSCPQFWPWLSPGGQRGIMPFSCFSSPLASNRYHSPLDSCTSGGLENF